MKETDKHNETDRCVVYKQCSQGTQLSMIFNKEEKNVDISFQMFIRNDEPMWEPMDSNVRYSAKYGHWQQLSPILSIEDIEFLYKKTKELFQ